MRLTSMFALLLIAATGPGSRAPIEGRWRNPSGSAVIAIAPCSNALCGKVVWASARGRVEAARGASDVVGLNVLTGVTRSGDHWTGNLFIPDDNIHVAAKLRLLNERQLMLTGCAFAGLFCRSQVWTRI